MVRVWIRACHYPHFYGYDDLLEREPIPDPQFGDVLNYLSVFNHFIAGNAVGMYHILIDHEEMIEKLYRCARFNGLMTFIIRFNDPGYVDRKYSKALVIVRDRHIASILYESIHDETGVWHVYTVVTDFDMTKNPAMTRVILQKAWEIFWIHRHISTDIISGSAELEIRFCGTGHICEVREIVLWPEDDDVGDY